MGRRKGRQSERTLVCAVQALVGLEILVELRNDVTIRGVLDDCDDSMNVIMKDTVAEDVEGVQTDLPLMFVRGSNIRFIHIPQSIKISQAIEERRLILDQAEHAYLGGKGAPAPKPSDVPAVPSTDQ